MGAKGQIDQLIWDLARKEGKAIIPISSDMAEVVKLARRILVCRDKRIVGQVTSLNERRKIIKSYDHPMRKGWDWDGQDG